MIPFVLSSKRNPSTTPVISQIVRIVRAGLRVFFGLSWLSFSLIERNLEDEPIPDIQPRTKVDILRGGPSEIELASSCVPPIWIREFEQRLKQGKIWVIGLVDGRFAYSAWFTFQDEIETVTGTLVHLAPQEAYLYNCFTVPEFRRLGLHTYMLAEQLRIARDMGTKKVLGIVSTDNLASRRGFYKVGYRDKQHLLIIRFLRWCHVFELDLI